MDTDIQYSLTFYGSNGSFEYLYGTFSEVEFAFRTPRVSNLTWTMDGDGWSSQECFFSEALHYGTWYITRYND